MHDLSLITTIAAAFTAAWICGLITHKLRLSPIVGYLLGGVLVGPFTPGVRADLTLAPQLAEIGVMLLMFGVGLHFHLKDLLAVRNVAVPGAIFQSAVATLLGLAVAAAFGWQLRSGLVLGMAMAVASTVVLIRVLTDNKLLDSTAGHVAVGWLIVEDVLTVIVLVLIPALGAATAAAPGAAPDPGTHVAATQALGHAATQAAVAGAHPAGPQYGLMASLLIAMAKLAALVTILLVFGSKIIPWVMIQVARLRSRELFTLTVLVMAIAIATASYYVFGASMALGAFLAGMVVGQSPVSHQAAADALPLRDAFAVLFFSSVGMLFDPSFLIREPGLLFAGLGIILIGKPLAALLIVAIIGYPARTALVVALGLAQIGEFSFILSDLGRQHGLLGDAAHNLLVASAIVTITLNPLLFRTLAPTERFLQSRLPAVWRFLNRKSQRLQAEMNAGVGTAVETTSKPLAVIVGYGPVGQTLDTILRQTGLETVIVDLNMDTVQNLTRQGRFAFFGDAYNIEVMHQALPGATHLVITLPHSTNRNPVIAAAKLINPELKVFVRARYLLEREELEQVGADAVCFEEAEAAVALANMVLIDRGADPQTILRETTRIREDLHVPLPHPPTPT